MEDTISKEKLSRYFTVTRSALKAAKENIKKGRGKQASEILQMVENYISDAGYFEAKGNLVDAFAALNYAHGWLDSGARLGIFDVKDDKLFTVK